MIKFIKLNCISWAQENVHGDILVNPEKIIAIKAKGGPKSNTEIYFQNHKDENHVMVVKETPAEIIAKLS